MINLLFGSSLLSPVISERQAFKKQTLLFNFETMAISPRSPSSRSKKKESIVKGAPTIVKMVCKSDILCGRGKSIRNHPGNIIYRKAIDDNCKHYQSLQKKHDKGVFTKNVIKTAWEKDARFIKKNKATGVWELLEYEEVYEKVSHALRSTEDAETKEIKKKNKKESKKKEREEGGLSDFLSIASIGRPPKGFWARYKKQQQSYEDLVKRNKKSKAEEDPGDKTNEDFFEDISPTFQKMGIIEDHQSFEGTKEEDADDFFDLQLLGIIEDHSDLEWPAFGLSTTDSFL